MIEKTIYLEYREAGDLSAAYSVALASSDGTYGVKEYASGDVLVPSGTSVDSPSTGKYQKSITFEANKVYVVSWQVVANVGGDPKYVVEQVGPLDDESTIRAVADKRGTFIVGKRSQTFLRITDIDGNAREPELISYTAEDSAHNVAATGTPERVAEGFYVFDWNVPQDQPTGAYSVLWEYTVDGEEKEVLQEIVVVSAGTDTDLVLYAPRIMEMRDALSWMIKGAQAIPVYKEPAKKSRDRRTFEWTFPRWNQSSGVRIFVDDEIVTDGVEIDYFKGKATFDLPITAYENVEASYNFRWFSDDELDRFLSNSIQRLNIEPPVNRYTLMTVPDRWIHAILEGAAVAALRSMMLSIQFQEAQLVFGGPEGAAKAFSNFEALKKNYEETWKDALEKKKYGPYVGLTKTVVTPEFALPGGRSRWFRYLYSSGS